MKFLILLSLHLNSVWNCNIIKKRMSCYLIWNTYLCRKRRKGVSKKLHATDQDQIIRNWIKSQRNKALLFSSKLDNNSYYLLVIAYRPLPAEYINFCTFVSDIVYILKKNPLAFIILWQVTVLEVTLTILLLP